MQRDDRLRNRAELGIRTEHLHIIGERAKCERDTLRSVQSRIVDIVRANFVLITRKEGGA